LFDNLILYVQDVPLNSLTPYSNLISFSGLIAKLGSCLPVKEKVHILDQATQEIQIESCRFNLKQVQSFFNEATKNANEMLTKILLGFSRLHQDFSELIYQVGSEVEKRSIIGESIIDSFPGYGSQKSIFKNYLKDSLPDYFCNKYKREAWLRECDELLSILLVLIHTTVGAAPRCTELLSITIANQQYSSRNLYIRNGNVLV
jgi:hypothetical protein